MRLMLGLLGATTLHALVLGAGMLLLPRQLPAPASTAAVDVDVVPLRPEPVAPQPIEAGSVARAEKVARRVRPRPAPVLARAPEPEAGPAVEPAPAPAPVAIAAAPASAVVAAHAVAPPASAPVGGERARFLTKPLPDYPTASRRRREQGTVMVRIAVAPDGRPTAVSLEKSCGHPLLDDAAVDGARRWTFQPAGAPSLLVVPVTFSLDDGAR